MARRFVTLDNIPPEDHESIGLVANAWSHLEGAVERIIWRLARIDDNHGAAITTHMGIGNRIDAALALANLEFPKAHATQRLKKLKKPIKDTLYSNRNRIVHSRVLYLDASGHGQSLRPTYKARGELKKSVEPVDRDECQTIAQDMMDVVTELRDIIAAYYELIETKYGTPPP